MIRLIQRFKVAIAVVTTLGAGGAVVGHQTVQWMNKPVTQTIQTQDPTPDATASSDPKSVETKLYTTQIPGHYRVQATENPKQPGLVQSLLFDPNETGKQVGITVNTLPADGLNGVADYIYRTHMTDLYQVFTEASLPPGAQAFRKTSRDGNEISLFMTHGARYASITVSSPAASTGQLLALLHMVTDNWQWK